MAKVGNDLVFSEPKTFKRAALLFCPGPGFWHQAARATLIGAMHFHLMIRVQEAHNE